MQLSDFSLFMNIFVFIGCPGVDVCAAALYDSTPRRRLASRQGVQRGPVHDITAVRDVATCILYKRRVRTAPRSHSVGFMRIGAYGCVQMRTDACRLRSYSLRS
jgi:hypothetical protein